MSEEEFKLSKLLGTEEQEIEFLSCGKVVTLRPAKLSLAAKFERKFGADRYFLNARQKEGEQNMTREELSWVLWNLIVGQNPWKTVEAMEEDITIAEIISIQEIIYSFFCGVRIGDLTSSDSSDGESL